MSNVYYNPEKSGLTTVGEIEAGGGYDFDTFVIFRDNGTGRLWWAEDAGCSCPTPFEDVSFEDGLHELFSVTELHAALRKWCGDGSCRPEFTGAEVGYLILKARAVGTFAMPQIGGEKA